MDSLFIILFYLLAGLFIYNYFIYPACIIILAAFKKALFQPKKSYDTDYMPTVSFIIAAYNEEKVIKTKLENTLSLDYPEDKFEIIVASDGSDDSTVAIVKEYSAHGVISLHESARNGKSAALNRGVEHSSGEIIVFSDANNDFSNNAIKMLVRHFQDENIGAVTGAKHIYENRNRQSSAGDGLYWKYESKIKEAESTLGSITGAEGEILAVRKSLFKPIDKKIINDDAAITFDMVRSGHRIIYDSDAKAYEQASIDLLDDFNVKVRMTAGGYQTIGVEKKYLFPPRNWFGFTFISHKLLRWLAPHILILLFIIPLFYLHRTDMKLFAALQIIFYFVSLYGWKKRATPLPKLVYIPMYFSVMNMALFWGFIRFINNKTESIWKKAER